MKIVKKDLKHGTIALKLQNADDLWHLQHILHKGSLLKTRTMRKVAVRSGGEFRMSEKKPMVLTIEVEKTSFDDTTGTLKVSGKIAEGPAETRLSSYHTMRIEPGAVVTVRKPHWASSDMKRIRDSETRQPKVLVCVMDRDEADVALVSGSGITAIGRIESHDPENKEPYRKELLDFLREQTGYDALVVAGPGFEAANFAKFARENSKLAPVVESCSNTGVTGINEVMKKSGERVIRDSRIGQESELVERLMAGIKSDGLVTYGPSHVKKAVEAGAAETLLVSREKTSEFEDLISTAEKMGSRIVFISADHTPGEQFLHLGGIAAFLRFRAE